MLRSYPEPLHTILSQQIAAVMEMSEYAYERSKEYAEERKKAEEEWKRDNEEIVKRDLKGILETVVIADIKRKIVKEKHEEQARYYEQRKSETVSVLVPSYFQVNE